MLPNQPDRSPVSISKAAEAAMQYLLEYMQSILLEYNGCTSTAASQPRFVPDRLPYLFQMRLSKPTS